MPIASGLRTLARDIVAALARQVLTVGMGVALSILLARSLGPTGNGRYALAILLPTMLATFLSLGIAPANVYFVGRGEVSLGTALRTNLRLWLGLCFVGIVLSFAVISLKGDSWFPGVPAYLLWLAIAIFPPMLLCSLLTSLIQAKQDFQRFNRSLVATSAVTLVLAAVLVSVLDMGVLGGLLAAAGGSVAGLLVAMGGFSVREEAHPASDAVPYAGRCLSYGWKAHLSNVLTFVNYRADLLLLNLFLTPAATGIYVVAVQIAERLWFLSQAVSTVLLPRLSELHSDEAVRRSLTPLVARWVLLVSVVGALPLALAAPLLVRVLFGTAYAQAVGAFLWLLPGVILGGVARVISNDIAARGRPDLNLYVSVIVVVVNVGGNIVLIPRLGIDGAAIATTMAYSLNMALKSAVYSRISGNEWWQVVVLRGSDWLLFKRAAASIVSRTAALASRS